MIERMMIALITNKNAYLTAAIKGMSVGSTSIPDVSAYANMTGKPMTFVPHGIFVGARLNSTDDANNRDFGHQKKGKSILPGGIMNLEAEMTLDAAGTWRFWPAYMVDNHYGPFRWCEIAIEVAGSPDKPMKQWKR